MDARELQSLRNMGYGDAADEIERLSADLVAMNDVCAQAEDIAPAAVAAERERCAAMCDRARTDFTTEPPVGDYARGFRDASLLLAKAFRDEAQRGNANV